MSLSLHEPFLTNTALASAVLSDVSYPETPIVLEDLHLVGNQSVQPFIQSASRRVRSGDCFSSATVFMMIADNTRCLLDLTVTPLLSLFRYITFRNFYVTDQVIVKFLEVLNGVPLTSFRVDGVTLMGLGR